MKPDVVNDYNKNMRLVDKADMQITSVDCLRKTSKWPRKIVFHLIDVCLLNSYNMYMVKTWERSLLPKFSKTVVTQLLERFGEPRSIESRPGRRSTEARSNIARLRFADAFAIHAPVCVPPPPGKPTRRGQRECVVCKETSTREKKHKLVTAMCKGCNVALCFVELF